MKLPCFLCLLTSGALLAQETLPRGDARMARELAVITQEASSPEEIVARKEALLAPIIAAERVALDGAPRTAAPESLAPTEDSAKEAAEARQVLAGVQAEAKSPEEIVAVTQEFFRLNAWLVEPPAPKPLEPPADNGSPDFDAVLALYEVKASARSAEEDVALTEAFFRLNPELSKPPSEPSNL